jgi:hypothetical protein
LVLHKSISLYKKTTKTFLSKIQFHFNLHTAKSLKTKNKNLFEKNKKIHCMI